MGNYSRDTFIINKLKHYVGVRLQQGVPIVDADWNEQEDIRKAELETFLRWFIGSGVPKGNDGFRILPIAGNGVNTIVLTSNKASPGSSSIVVNRDASTAADALGFGPDHCSTSRSGSSPAQLTGDATEPFTLTDGMTLVISTDGLQEETITFQADSFADISAATAAEVVAVINGALKNLIASAGTGNDFDIKGGDGTPEGAGRCLVEGWDAIIESNLKYTEQPLYDNAALAEAWRVDPVLPLTTPTADRTETVYLDVWEREVDSAEDQDLVNPAIGVETCVRTKREWAVRVAEGATTAPAPPSAHVFYPLASLSRMADEATIAEKDITDLRRTGLSLVSYHDMRQRGEIPDIHVTDAFLKGSGDHALPLYSGMSLTVNALSRGLHLVCSDDVNPATANEAACSITLEVPFSFNEPNRGSGGDTVVGYEPLTLAARVHADGKTISWRPTEQTNRWLRDKLFERRSCSVWEDEGTVAVSNELQYFDLADTPNTVFTSFAPTKENAQRIFLTMRVERDSPGVGLVFNWQDADNYWVLLYRYYLTEEGTYKDAVAILQVQDQQVSVFGERDREIGSEREGHLPPPRGEVHFGIKQATGELAFGIGSFEAIDGTKGFKGSIPRPTLLRNTRVGAWSPALHFTVMSMHVVYPDFAETLIPSMPTVFDPFRGNRVLGRLTLKCGFIQLNRDGDSGSDVYPPQSAPRFSHDFERWFWLTPPERVYPYYWYSERLFNGFPGIGVELMK